MSTRNVNIILLLGLSIIGCKQSRKETNILYSTHISEVSTLGNVVEKPEDRKWHFTKIGEPVFFPDELLFDMSAVVLGVSDINKLDHRTAPQLKRYLEAGGGGIVLIRDTIFNNTGFPWLQKWSEMEEGSFFEQDMGRLAIVGSGYSEAQWNDALDFAIGDNTLPDFTLTTTVVVPDSNRYTRDVLAENLDEPLQLAVLPNKDVLFIERKGGVKYYDHNNGKTKQIANINVFSGIEDGLLGVVLDPGFEKNNWIYLYYAAAGDTAVSRLSRFELFGDSLVIGSERILLEIPTQRTYCCHSAGHLLFDKEGLLYLSTGDNTNAEETEGYTPIDERPGRQLSDDQATTANTNDLRGKILRIRPLSDGSYEIPDGNLFSKNDNAARPEIYVMGARNPFRFSVDPKTGYLYFGDVGPDTKVRASTGEYMSFDEINQVREPGYFGWPYFLGNNEIFPKYDFGTKTEGPGKNPQKPINDSPNNTGKHELPRAIPAMIWYGKGNSARFPLVGNGGASAMAGPVFNSSDYSNALYKLSDYYDGKLFIYEWIRGWIMAITFDENGNYQRMEPFLEHLKFDAPVDMQFANDGSLYILEYGTNWFSKNTNAKLVRIRYAEGNRNPDAVIELDKQYGAAPMTVHLSAEKSTDYDLKDRLEYSWVIEGKTYVGKEVSHIFENTGTFDVQLLVSDGKGGTGKTSRKIFVGNTPPEVSIVTTANRSFYWDDVRFDYDIHVADNEDAIDPERLKISFGYIPHGKDAATILSSNLDVGSYKFLEGKQMVNSLDCKSCHSIDKESIGPSFLDIAKRYSGKQNKLKYLTAKIIEGGSGNWGVRPMTPHPALSSKESENMVKYILSLGEKTVALPSKNVIPLKEHVDKGVEGAYLLNALYRDQGANGIGELEGNDHVLLKNPTVEAEDFDEGNVHIANVTTAFLKYIWDINEGKYVKFDSIDLTHVKRLIYRVQPSGPGGTIKVHLDSKDGPVVSSIDVFSANAGNENIGWEEIAANIKKTQGIHDLYFVFTGKGQNLFNVDWIRFSNK